MKVLFLGDSISIHYAPFLSEYALSGTECCFRPGREAALKDLDRPSAGNSGNSSMPLEYIESLASQQKLSFDAVVFNCGLHDIKVDKKTGQTAISLAEYTANLRKIIAILKDHSITPIFVTITPVDDNRHNASDCISFYRYNRDVLRYNQAAQELMRGEGVSVIDLYSFTQTFGKACYKDHVHYAQPFRKLQAAFITGYLNALFSTELAGDFDCYQQDSQ